MSTADRFLDTTHTYSLRFAHRRFYLEVMFLDKSDGGVTNYFFFSRLWSVGRVCDFVDGKVGGKLENDRIEFLIKVRVCDPRL